MHFRSAAAEYGCGVEGYACMFQSKLRGASDAQRLGGRNSRLAEFFRGDCLLNIAFVVALQLLEHPLPPVALIRHLPLQHAERCRCVALADIFDGAAEGRNVRKVRLLGEESPDLAIRIEPWFRMAKHLHNQLIAKKNGSIT